MNTKLVAQLRVVGGAKPAAIRLRLPATVGRSADASLKVPQSQVSRRHCEIYEEDGQLVVDDLGSSNGTFINDQRVTEPTFLLPGERLRVGLVVFEAVYHLAPGDGDADVVPQQTEIIESEPHGVADVHVDSAARAQAPESPSAARSVKSTANSKACPGLDGHASAIVSYEESEQGSFLGIEEIDTAGDSRAAHDAKSPLVIDVHERTNRVIDPDDSALDHFLKGLG